MNLAGEPFAEPLTLRRIGERTVESFRVVRSTSELDGVVDMIILLSDLWSLGSVLHYTFFLLGIARPTPITDRFSFDHFAGQMIKFILLPSNLTVASRIILSSHAVSPHSTA